MTLRELIINVKKILNFFKRYYFFINKCLIQQIFHIIERKRYMWGDSTKRLMRTILNQHLFLLAIQSAFLFQWIMRLENIELLGRIFNLALTTSKRRCLYLRLIFYSIYNFIETNNCLRIFFFQINCRIHRFKYSTFYLIRKFYFCFEKFLVYLYIN